MRDPETQGASRDEMRHVADTPDAKAWEGWGTALKPALEPIVVARKPVSEKTVAANVLKWGVGGINIDGTRVGNEEVTINTFDNGAKPWGDAVGEAYTGRKSVGRWPANVMFTHAEDCVEVGSVVETISNHNAPKGTFAGGEPERGSDTSEYRDYEVSTAVFECVDGCPVKEVNRQADGSGRFFYTAKANKKDRNEGLVEHNLHPTVKPTSLMRELVRLITPKGGVVLDPFTGSGSTGKAAILEGFGFVGVELTSEYLPIIEGRLNHAAKQVDGQLEF